MYCSDGAAHGHKIKIEAQLVGAERYLSLYKKA